MSEENPELQSQLEEQKKNCIFCKIINKEIESKKIYEDNELEGILDINPCIKGHTILFPKEHYPIMPLIPPKTFKHIFGIMPELVNAIKQSMLSTGANVLIANGYAAGQQAPHFLVHLLPREEGDGIFNFSFNKKEDLNEDELKKANSMVSNNLPIMMKNHFSRSPADWHKGDIKTSDFLFKIKDEQEVVYEDEKVLCVIPKNPQCVGHLEIYSNEEEKMFENLDNSSASHMFYVASYAATAVFEGLKAQGSNIILKTGFCDDNPDGRLSIHILPRFENDGLDVTCKPMPKKPDFDKISSKIKDKMSMVEYSLKKKEKSKITNLEPEIIKITANPEEKDFDSYEEEIKAAIDMLKKE